MSEREQAVYDLLATLPCASVDPEGFAYKRLGVKTLVDPSSLSTSGCVRTRRPKTPIKNETGQDYYLEGEDEYLAAAALPNVDAIYGPHAWEIPDVCRKCPTMRPILRKLETQIKEILSE